MFKKYGSSLKYDLIFMQSNRTFKTKNRRYKFFKWLQVGIQFENI